MIRFKHVSKTYKPNVVGLRNVSFHIKPGEFVSIVGQSGTGKTTLTKLIFAEEKANSGEVVIGGWNITKAKKRDIPMLRRQIGMVFQDFKLLPQKTAAENVAFALQVAGVKPRRIREVVPQVLKIVNLEHLSDRYPKQMSGGEQQRIVVARALVHRPKILIADEPTGNLDTVNTKEITNLLKKINEFGTTVLLVTHNREVVNSLKKRVITLEDGEIVSDVEEGRYKL